MSDDLRRLAASVVVTGFEGTTLPDWLRARLDEGLAGVCWFGQNVTDPDQATTLAEELHGVREGVVVMSDEEGGDVTRLEMATGSSWPGHAALGAVDDPQVTRAVAAGLGRSLRGAGIDIALAPVVDVNSEPDNPVIGVRSFGATPDLVARHGVAFVEGLQSVGVAACAKHFPGHGATHVDSHLGLPVVDDPVAVLRERDLAPFAAVVGAGVRCVMTAHVVFSAFGPEPATLSPRLLGLLREELGFEGVLISDALDMKAVADGVGHAEGAVGTLLAGTDLVCIGNPAFPEWYDAEQRLETVVGAVADALATGRLPRERVEEAAARVRSLTDWTSAARAEDAGAGDGGAGAAAAGRAVAQRGRVALSAPFVLDLGGGLNMAAGGRDRHLRDALLRRDARTTVVDVVDDGPADVAGLLERARDRSVVVLARTPREHRTRALLGQVLAARPDAVVVQTGLADHDAPGERTLWTHGGGRAVAEEAAARLVPEESR